jgi:peptide chain release factor 2
MFEAEAQRIDEYIRRLRELRRCLNTDRLREEAAEFEREMSAPNFWDNPDRAQKIVQRMKQLKVSLAEPDSLGADLEDALVLISLAQEEDDESLASEIDALTEKLEQRLRRIEISSLFNDPRDPKNAIVNIHPGAGGTESCDWAEMLFRMVMRFCERHDYEVEVMDMQMGEEAGLKSATIRVEGPFAYGNLKSEGGVHRLVRISPFDANKRRHTSFSAIEVLTEVDDDIQIEVNEDDLKVDVFRASGPGGQKVNKTSSAVRLTHIPTGIVVACQIERSQHRNRAMALQLLKAKLYDLEIRKQQAEDMARRESQSDVAWGSQIRSYVLHPYQMIKDHRTGMETGNVDRVLDGDLDMFVEAYLKWNLESRSETEA